MKRTLVLLLAVALCAVVFTPHFTQGQGRDQDKIRKAKQAIPNQYIVVLKNTLPKANVAAVANDLARQHGGNLRFVYEHALKGFSIQLPEVAAIALSHNPLVEYVAENSEGSIVDTQFNPPWGLDRIDQRDLPLNNAYSYNYTGAGVNAYIIDTGILASHVDFEGRASLAADYVNEGCADCNGHGTHVAGTVGGKTYGVAKGVTLRAVKVCNSGGGCAVDATIAGINYVTQQKQNNPGVPAVANMSLRFWPTYAPNDPLLTLDAAVRTSINAGVTYVVAAGNESDLASNYSPARVTEALTVGATDSSDNRAWFSNYGSAVDIFAPGVNILSAYIGSNTATLALDGTSMASPHVAGVAALYLQRYPTALPPTVNQAITNAATPNKVINPGSGSPNRLLYSLFIPAANRDTRADFDGDQRTDISVFHRGTGQWLSRNSSNGVDVSYSPSFGQSGDIATPGDYNGDGKTDRAVFRPGNGTWYVATDTSGAFYTVQFGQTADIPVARDYDGDGRTDHAVFRPGSGTWYILNSSNSTWTVVQFGQSGDRVVPGYYDSDNKADIAVFRPSDSTWYIRRPDGSFYGVTFGVTSDWPVQADYDGDGLTNIAVFRPSDGYWYVRRPDGTFYGGPLGASGDRPAPGDYDGDGKADFAVQHTGTGTWYVYNSATGTYTIVNPCSTFSDSCYEIPVPGKYLTPLY
jgi:subtilisin family serine protease